MYLGQSVQSRGSGAGWKQLSVIFFSNVVISYSIESVGSLVSFLYAGVLKKGRNLLYVVCGVKYYCGVSFVYW